MARRRKPKNERILLTTVTGEPFQPVRVPGSKLLDQTEPFANRGKRVDDVCAAASGA